MTLQEKLNSIPNSQHGDQQYKRILAIDPGSQCGWALYDNGILLSGSWNLTPSRYESQGMRLVHLLNYLRKIGRVDLVGYEEVHNHSVKLQGRTVCMWDAAHVYGAITNVLFMWCDTHEPPVPWTGITVQAIKKEATGKGRANKDQILRAARGRWPEQDIVDDNQADALFLLAALVKENGICVRV